MWTRVNCTASGGAGTIAGGKVVMVMTTIEGRPYWFGLSLPRDNSSRMGNRWWCAIVLLAIVYRRYGGMRSVIWCLGHAIDPRYVHSGRHYLSTTDDNPIPVIELIMSLRQERIDRPSVYEVSTRISNEIYGRQYVTPLIDRQWLDYKYESYLEKYDEPIRPRRIPTEYDRTEELPKLGRSLTIIV